MELGFWNFWIFIIIDIVLILSILGYVIYYNFFDKRLRTFIFYPNKQLEVKRKNIKDEVISMLDRNTGKNKAYTVNRDFIYFKNGRISYAFYWNNIPIPLNMSDFPEMPDKKKKELTELINKSNIILRQYDYKQIEVNIPSKKLSKSIEVETAETFFRLLYTNFTLNLIKPPKDLQKAIKWTAILIAIAIGIAVILHFLGVIDIMQFVGATPPK